jgi:uncharacterized protein YecT (DUF1311 family)
MRIANPALVVAVAYAMTGLAFAATDCSDSPHCWPEGSSMHTGGLLAKQLEELDKQLRQRNEELLALVKSGGVSFHPEERLLSALMAQAEGWLVYRQRECELLGANTRAGATWQSTNAVECEVRATTRRLGQVTEVLQCVKAIPLQMRVDDEAGCLEKLSVLLPGEPNNSLERSRDR